MPRARRTRSTAGKSVETLRHEEDTRTNIPTAEYQSMVREDTEAPLRVAYQRRNRDLDPQLVWRGKDEQDLADLVVNVPPLYIQEKVHPKVLIEDLTRSGEWIVKSGEKLSTDHSSLSTQGSFADLFADFNGLPEGADRTAFYQHEGYWQNRMILGDSLQVMASLSEREGLQGKVQCIYIDPPYGIKFNSNFQWSTTSRDVRDGNREHITREPEQVKAFRDTWRDGIHSYLTYLRDRLTIARDLLADSGSVFVQIGDENVHTIRAVLDEVFGERNFLANIVCLKTSGQASRFLSGISDYILMYGKNITNTKYRAIYREKVLGEAGTTQYVWFKDSEGLDQRITSQQSDPDPSQVFAADNLTGQGVSREATPYEYNGATYFPSSSGHWKPSYPTGMNRLARSERLKPIGRSLMYRRYLWDFSATPITNIWNDVLATGLTEQKMYVVQTSQRIAERCILMTTDPGDLVLDPTCGSGTTAYVAEQWGRRWITVDTSRVALALARARIMGARYPYYLLADSRDGQLKEAELSRRAPSEMPVYGNIRQGFVYERVPHITLRDIARNTEIDVIWEKHQEKLEPLREELNRVLETVWEEWEIPREGEESWPAEAQSLHKDWWELRIARQKEIDASIAARADYE